MRAILGGALLITGLRVALVLAAPDDGLIRPDSASYSGPARALLATGEYHACPGCAEFAFRVPAYPLFLAAAFGVLGESPRGVAFLQLALALGSTTLLTFSVKRRFGTAASLVAFLVLASDVAAAGQAAVILSESLASVFIAIALALASDSPPGAWQDAGLGVAVAGIALCRPEYWPLAFAAPVLLFSWRDALRRVFLVALVIWLPLGGWFLRSQALSRTTGLTSFYGRGLDNVATHFLVWRIEALDLGLSPEEAMRRVSARYPRASDLPSPVAVLRQRPLASARVLANGSASFWFMPDGYGEVVRTLGRPLESPIKDLARLSVGDYLARWPLARPLVLGLALLNVIQLAFLYAGIVILAPRRLVQSAMSRLALGITLTVALAGSVTGEPRYRTCALPALAVLSAQGWAGAASRFRSRRGSRTSPREDVVRDR